MDMLRNSVANANVEVCIKNTKGQIAAMWEKRKRESESKENLQKNSDNLRVKRLYLGETFFKLVNLFDVLWLMQLKVKVEAYKVFLAFAVEQLLINLKHSLKLLKKHS